MKTEQTKIQLAPDEKLATGFDGRLQIASAPNKAQHSITCNSGLAKYPNGVPEGINADRNCDCHNKAQHSPLPWSFAAVNGDNCIMAKDANGQRYIVAQVYDCADTDPDEREANKALIVRAVNHADKLAEAIREAIRNEDESFIREALAAYEAAQ